MSNLDEDQLKELREVLTDANESPRLTAWERTFVEDVLQRVNEYGLRVKISEKQYDIIKRIEGKIYGAG